MSEGTVLLADDEPAFQRLGGAWLRGFGYDVRGAEDAKAAVATFKAATLDVVILDLVMPPKRTKEAGIALIPEFSPVPVIVLTGHADHELALRATAAGAWDFIAKPVSPDLLRFAVARAVRQYRLENELRAVRMQERAGDLGMIGSSPAMERLREQVRRLGPSPLSVVILGPTGSGKELVARALHRTSLRAGGPFVPVHCGALSAELLESELFGHLRGSFTGAHRDQGGLVEAADRGTLFLDEVGEMPPPMQAKLLRFLQEGTFMPVGGRAEKHADVRVLAATNRDLDAMVAAGAFREDLFYRLRGMAVRTPSLAERREDILPLAAHFLRGPDPALHFTEDAAAYLQARPWPGNVRQLRAVVEAGAALADAMRRVVDAALLRFAAGETPADDARGAQAPPPPQGPDLPAAVAMLERLMIQDALAACGGNKTATAARLGVTRRGLEMKMRRLGVGS